MLVSSDRKISTDHQKVVGEWYSRTKHKMNSIPEVAFMKYARDLLIKEGRLKAYVISSESAVGEAHNRKITGGTYELAYYDKKGNRHDLAAAISDAIAWWDIQLKSMETQLPPRFEEQR